MKLNTRESSESRLVQTRFPIVNRLSWVFAWTLYSKQSYVFWFFNVDGFWRENGVIRLTVKNNSVSSSARTGKQFFFVRILREERKREKSFWKSHFIAKIWHSKNHQISKNFNKMAKNTKFKAQSLLNQLSFTNIFFHT